MAGKADGRGTNHATHASVTGHVRHAIRHGARGLHDACVRKRAVRSEGPLRILRSDERTGRVLRAVLPQRRSVPEAVPSPPSGHQAGLVARPAFVWTHGLCHLRVVLSLPGRCCCCHGDVLLRGRALRCCVRQHDLRGAADCRSALPRVLLGPHRSRGSRWRAVGQYRRPAS